MSKDVNTSFISRLKVPFLADEYKVTVAHELKDTRGGEGAVDETPISEYTLVVAGERFRLAESDITAVSPGRDRVGEFATHLPHIVLRKADLPWQRTVDKAAPTGTPWLALLVFDENDPPPEPKEIQLKDLEKRDQGTFHPDVTFSNHRDDKEKDRCRVIDVPAELFQAIAPGLDELPLLAHVREVPTDQKPVEHHAFSATIDEASDLLREAKREALHAVIIANRLPGAPSSRDREQPEDPEGFANTVHLVSLEGFGPHLPKADGSITLPPGTEFVRLVTLDSWSFGVLPNKPYSLKEVCKHLDAGSLRIPTDGISDVGIAAQHVRGALSLGYTALNHHTRTDDQTVSWYRGPLVPFPLDPAANDPVATADEAIRYDPEETGMFDVSYAAAWQLGRLLALHDTEFTESLNEWRLFRIRRTQSIFEQQRWCQEIGLPLPDSDADGNAGGDAGGDAEEVLQALVESLADGLGACLDAEPNDGETGEQP